MMIHSTIVHYSAMSKALVKSKTVNTSFVRLCDLLSLASMDIVEALQSVLKDEPCDVNRSISF